MPSRCWASSPELVLALALAACGGGGGDSDDPATTGGATTAVDGSSGGPVDPASTGTTDAPDPTTGAATSTTTGETGDEPSTGGSSTGADPCTGSVLTWENFGEPFMLSWCTGCHHSALPSAERACAPCATNFDTHAGVSAISQYVKLRVADYDTVEGLAPMPPAAVIPEDELALLREWIDCGAPGPEVGADPPACPDPGVVVDGC
jgi:hypothetical protein